MNANDKKKGFAAFGNCSGNLENLREMMNNFCVGPDRDLDCSILMEKMMENCCGLKAENTESNSNPSNESG